MKKQSGFAVLELLLIVVVLGAIGFTAVTYYSHRQQAVTDTTGSVAATVTVPSAPQISTTADLTTAESTLDQLNVDASSTDSSQLDAELTNF